jgi:hypothetical protein
MNKLQTAVKNVGNQIINLRKIDIFVLVQPGQFSKIFIDLDQSLVLLIEQIVLDEIFDYSLFQYGVGEFDYGNRLFVF